MSEPITIDSGALTVPGNGTVPHLSQWFGWWHYEPQRAAAMYDHLRKIDVAAHVRTWQAERSQQAAKDRRNDQQANPASPNDPPPGMAFDDAGYVLQDGIALIELNGSLMKHVSSMDDGTSTVRSRRLVRLARSDAAVKAVVVVVDSPGGTVAGAYDLADDIKALAAVKPTYGYAADLACSAGYLQLAMCRQISANRTALVGCIGTFGVMYDYSEMFKQDGVKPIVISSGGFKGAGVPGTSITDEQVKEWQREIDGLNAAFIDAVAAGRNIARDRAAVLADGRTFIAAEAKSMGLIDRVESLDTLVARVRKEMGTQQAAAPAPVPDGGTANPNADDTDTDDDGIDGVDPLIQNDSPATADAAGDHPEPAAPVPNQEAIMAEEKKDTAQASKPQPASLKELRSAFAKNPEFAMDCHEKGLTLVEAKADYADVLQKQIDDQAKAEAEKPKGKIGVAAVPSGRAAKPGDEAEGGYTGNAKADFDAAVRKEMASNKGDRKAAIKTVARRDPALHRAYLEATNPKKKQRDLIADKYGDEE